MESLCCNELGNKKKSKTMTNYTIVFVFKLREQSQFQDNTLLYRSIDTLYYINIMQSNTYGEFYMF